MRIIVLTAVAALLAGCGSDPEVSAENASVEEVARQVGASSGDGFIRPGQWQSTVAVESIDLPGLPPQMAEQMKEMLAARQVRQFESCLTPEQTRRPREEFFAGNSNACRYDRFEMGGGTIDARMTCSEGGGQQVIEMDGSYSPDTYSMQMQTEVSSGEGPAMTMSMRVNSRRTGECTAAQG